MDQNASRPLFNDEHIVRIRQGRHPLLDRKKVVPIDVELGKNFDLLVITGPNTGGKTVCLKNRRTVHADGAGRSAHSCPGPLAKLSVFQRFSQISVTNRALNRA